MGDGRCFQQYVGHINNVPGSCIETFCSGLTAAKTDVPCPSHIILTQGQSFLVILLALSV